MKNLIFAICMLFVTVQLTTAQTCFPVIYCDTGKQVIRILEYKSGGIIVNRGYYNGSVPYTPSSRIVFGNCDSTITNQNRELIDSLMANNTLTRRNIDSLMNNNTLTRRTIDSINVNNTLTRRTIDSFATLNTQLRKGNDTLAASLQTLKNGNQLVKISNGTITSAIAASAVSASNLDNALVVDQRPITASFGANTTTVTSYTTDANSITTTGCIKVIVENKSTSTDGTVVYGGVGFNLGKKGNTSGYSTVMTFESIYDYASKKYSPFATLVVNALASNIVVTKIFTQ